MDYIILIKVDFTNTYFKTSGLFVTYTISIKNPTSSINIKTTFNVLIPFNMCNSFNINNEIARDAKQNVKKLYPDFKKIDKILMMTSFSMAELQKDV